MLCINFSFIPNEVPFILFENIKKHTVLNTEKEPIECFFIDLKMHKTKRQVLIPLIDKAVALINFKELS